MPYSPTRIALLLEHESMDTTQIYLHANLDPEGKGARQN
jgi:hypothetical protein